METAELPEIEFDPRDYDEIKVHAWRADQLRRLGVPTLLATSVAGVVDWHDVAALVRRGCPPLLALEIAR